MLKTRAQFLDIEVIVGSYDEIELTDDICGVMLQYPNNDGYVRDYSDIIKRANQLKVNIHVVHVKISHMYIRRCSTCTCTFHFSTYTCSCTIV